MKRIVLSAAAAMFAVVSLQAQNDASGYMQAGLRSVTLFRSGAELTHTVSVDLASGVNDVSVGGLAYSADLSSMAIKCSGGVTVVGSSFSADYMAKQAVSDEVKRIRDSIRIYDRELSALKVRQRSVAGMLEVLASNMTAAKVSDALTLQKMMDYYRRESIALNTEQDEITGLISAIGSRVRLLNNQIGKEERARRDKLSGNLKLMLAAPLKGRCDIEVRYFVSGLHASWTPSYDIVADGGSDTLKLTLKASLQQKTGIDWTGADIRLTTAEPSNGRQAPALRAWLVGSAEERVGRMNTLVLGSAAYDGGDISGLQPVAENINLDYSIRPKVNPELYVVDGQSVSADVANSIAPYMIESSRNISGDAAQKKYGHDAVRIITTKRDFVSKGETASADAVYDIELPYDLLADGGEHTVTLNTIEVPAEVEYYCVPQIDRTVYLVAKVADWERYGLPAGNANITSDGTYAGKTELGAGTAGSGLSLTLGQERDIVVTREKLKDDCRTRLVGNEKRQSLAYRISVENNRNIPVEVVLKEQYPVSTSSDITVELDDTDGAQNDSETGVLTWRLKLPPGGSRRVQAGYTVRSPKDFDLF